MKVIELADISCPQILQLLPLWRMVQLLEKESQCSESYKFVFQ